MSKRLEDLRAELYRLHRSMEFAYAMGHSHTLGDHPTFRAIRQHEADLRAQIAEHESP